MRKKNYTLVGTTNLSYKELIHEYYYGTNKELEQHCDDMIQGIESCARAGHLCTFKRNWFYPLFGGKKYKVIVKK